MIVRRIGEVNAPKIRRIWIGFSISTLTRRIRLSPTGTLVA